MLLKKKNRCNEAMHLLLLRSSFPCISSCCTNSASYSAVRSKEKKKHKKDKSKHPTFLLFILRCRKERERRKGKKKEASLNHSYNKSAAPLCSRVRIRARQINFRLIKIKNRI
uniref:hypothetical protein 35 n=1 Tax=Moniliophthora perniciosa TaxID=153609 RepID=UPI000024237F|nr:hypothetical protein 35 [Moniliophthora perniciosa]AAQ74325.1 hypothetical protein 35 [Moniliophthora perniciosa]